MITASVLLAAIGYGFVVVALARFSRFNDANPGTHEFHDETLEGRIGLNRG